MGDFTQYNLAATPSQASIPEGVARGVSHKRATISDVAEALGISKGTVSRALNGYPDISEATRTRIQKMAAKMDYRPLAHAQAIRTGRVRSLGLVLQEDEYDGQSPFLSNFLQGITQEVGAQGWTLTVSAATGAETMLTALKSLSEERKVDGFILPRTRIRDGRIDLLRSLNVPFVLFGRTEDDEDCAWYDIQGGAAMRAAVANLAQLGHQQIAFINGGDVYNYSRLRCAGYQEGMSKAGLTVERDYIQSGAVTEDLGAEATERLMRLPVPPTAIICALDRAALGAYRTLAKYNFQAGREVSIVGYDGIPEGAYAQPPLTTYAVDNRQAGAQLARLLIERVRGAPPQKLRETDHAILVNRASDGPPMMSARDLAKIVSTK
ncbi:LacI family DNA-binding transcriptional regulator [Falsihalocynthiibacter sp. SS001]|uniref:LacI family DNA-binding transcriptional regulator n=1 Tax=Falsihalocynthiibacter sp. SS001 TaxID=3349698 RepID=UPI0036D2F32C